MSKRESPLEPVDLQAALEQGNTLLSHPPTTPESVKETLESLSSSVEQVRYSESERLSSTGQAVLKDLEEVLVSGAEFSEAIPTETFLHAARAQKEARQAIHPEKIEINPETEQQAKTAVMDIGRLAKTMLTSSELRHFVSDFMLWLRSALLEQIESAQKPEAKEAKETKEPEAKEVKETKEIGQVPIESIEPANLPAEITKFKLSNDQLDRFIGLLEWAQEKPEYQEAIGFVFNGLGSLFTDEEEVEQVIDQEALNAAMAEAKQAAFDALKAVENWTHRSFDSFQQSLTKTSENLKNDKQLRNAINSLSHFLANCFTEPGFLNDRQWIRNEADDLITQLKERLAPANRSDFQFLMDESRGILEATSDEPRTAHLKESLRRLLEDLFIAKEHEGQGFQFKTELISDLGVIAAGLMERVRLIRLPDLEIHDEEFDFTAHNIILDAAELIPQQFKLSLVTENMQERAKMEQESSSVGLSEEDKHRIFVERDPSILTGTSTLSGSSISTGTSTLPSVTTSTTPWATFIKFEVKGVRGHCRNLHFGMRKRSGFPQLSDEGTADLRVWGRQGMLVKVVLKPEWIVEQTETQTLSFTTEQKLTPQVMEKPEKTSPVQQPAQTSATASKLESTTTTPHRQKLKLSVVKARCDIDELDLDLHGTRHSWFYTVLGPLVRRKVKSALEGAVERNLLSMMD